MLHFTSIEIVTGLILLVLILIINIRLYILRKRIEILLARFLKKNQLDISEKEISELLRQRKGIHSLVEALPKLAGGSSRNPSLDKMDKMLQETERGYADFVCPDVMKIGVSERITADIFLSKRFYDLMEDKSTLTEISVSEVMSADLNGGTAFEVIGLHNKKQIIDKSRKTHWQWNVKPLKKEKHSLILLLSAQLKASNSIEGSLDVPLFEKKVHVNVNVPYDMGAFFSL